MQLEAVESSSSKDLSRTEVSQEKNKSKRGVARTSSQLLQVIMVDAIIPALELPEKDPMYVDLNQWADLADRQKWQSNKSSSSRRWVIGDHSMHCLCDGNHLQSALTIWRCMQIVSGSPSRHSVRTVSLYCYHLPTSTAVLPVFQNLNQVKLMQLIHRSTLLPFVCVLSLVCSTSLHTHTHPLSLNSWMLIRRGRAVSADLQ